MLRQAAAEPGAVPDLQVASVRLHRSRSGAEPVAEAVRVARTLVDGSRSGSSQDPYLPLVLLELGVAENWLGELVAAEEHLGECLLVSRSEDLAVVTAEALSHLAMTRLMAGSEQSCLELASEVLALATSDPGVPEATRGRALLVTRLVDLQSLPGPLRAPGGGGAAPPLPDDLAARFWHRILVSRLALADGSVVEAQRALAVPFEGPPLPEHLRVVALMERAAHALVTVSRDALREVAVGLGDLDAPGEQLWLRGAIADLDGDLRAAAASYRTAAALACRSQPPTAALAQVCAAQLHDRLGDPETARDLLCRAVADTRSRGHAGPFLGWSVHGTRVGDLLGRAGTPAPSGWQAELRAAFAERPSVAALFAPLVATDRELAGVAEPRVTPVLSPREHEVLNELARGATYGDIAATLFVSENTVKTHVSSLYAKLSAGRRSEALAVARKMHLL